MFIGNNWIEHVAVIADGNRRWLRRRKELIAPRLEHLPKRRIRIIRVARQVLRSHPEWKGFQLNFILATFECFVNETVDLFHFVIRHGVTAD